MNTIDSKDIEKEGSFRTNNNRIAKNTLLLYVRMLFSTIVAFYTSRVVLNVLGVEDYGVFNVVGGIILLFSVLTGALTNATQRYLTFSLGKSEFINLKQVFSTSIIIHLLLALFVLLLGETIGLFIVKNYLVIPEQRLNAALWVYHFSVISTLIAIIIIPFNADIIAHERMSAFAYISISEVVLKLSIVFLLKSSPWDKLVSYSILLFIVQLIIGAVYIFYCRQCFEETKRPYIISQNYFKEMVGFSGWSFMGSLASVLYTQGINILLNIFFGPVVNASRGISIQVQSAVEQFARNFQTALNPQITKNYATGNLLQMHILMFRSARFSFYLLYILVIPIILETGLVLKFWLKTVPDYSVIFVRIMLVTALIYTFVNPCIIANQATGKIKKYQIVVAGILLTILPLSYVVLRMGAPAYSVFIIHLIMECVAQLARMVLLRDLIALPLKSYFSNVYLPVSIVVATSIVPPILVHHFIGGGLLRFVTLTAVSCLSIGMSVWFLGLRENERTWLKSSAQLILKKMVAH